MMDILRRFFVVGFAALALAACESNVAVQTFPEMTFKNLPTLGLNVAKVEVVSDFKPSIDPPHIEEIVPTSPETALRRWAADRLAAKGPTSGNIARFTIVDGSMTEQRLKTDTGLMGVVKDQQSMRYTATAAATLEILDDHGFRKAFASARVSRSNTIAESASIDDRNRLWYKLVEDLMHDFDAEMDLNVRDYVGAYLM